MSNIFTPWRLKWYPGFILLGVLFGFSIAVLCGDGAATLTGRLGGDYVEFYSAGKIIAEGDWNQLYSKDKQFAIQKEFLPQEDGFFVPFVYPSFWAVAYLPLSFIDFRVSYVIHTALMVCALLAAVRMLVSSDKRLRDNYILAFCFALTFYPMFRAVFGGQNTPLSFLLIVLSWRFISTGREGLGGMTLGLLLFKPQFALPLIGLHLLSGRWRVAVSSLPIAALFYGISAYISGPLWMGEWMSYARWVAQIDTVVGLEKLVSWLGFFRAILGFENPVAISMGIVAVIITAVCLALMWYRAGRSADYTSLLGVTVAGLILLSPHAFFYDVGLSLFACFALLRELGPSKWLYPALVWIAGFGQIAAGAVGFSPSFITILFVLILSINFLYPKTILSTRRAT